jgi:hypothetical protein
MQNIFFDKDTIVSGTAEDLQRNRLWIKSEPAASFLRKKGLARFSSSLTETKLVKFISTLP